MEDKPEKPPPDSLEVQHGRTRHELLQQVGDASASADKVKKAVVGYEAAKRVLQRDELSEQA